jgi:hypothetical protein
VLAFAPKLPTAKLTAELCDALLRSFSAAESVAEAQRDSAASAVAPSAVAGPKRRAPARTLEAPREGVKSPGPRTSESAARAG